MFGSRRARLGTLLFAVPAIPAMLWFSPARRLIEPAPPMKIEVDLSSRRLTVLRSGKVVRRYGVAVGRPSHPTPTGSFRTGFIDWNPSWTPPDEKWAKNKKPQPPGSPRNPMQGVKIFFKAPDLFIHGTNDPGSIGEAASHGCIRMTADDATSLARLIQRSGGSVPLVIHG